MGLRSVPGRVQKFFGTHDTAFGSDEDLEHGELFPGEGDVMPSPVNLPSEADPGAVRDLSHGRPVVGAPAVERPELSARVLADRRAW
jgi:hypothetical protein